MKFNQQREYGQVMVILALVLVGLLGFAALVVDGGTIFADRRFDQSAADASAVAGAVAAAQSIENQYITNGSFTCSDSRVIAAMQDAADAAIARSLDNRFTLTELPTQADLDAARHGVYIACGEEDHDAFSQGYIDVVVNISSDVATTFAHMFYPGGFRNSVEAGVRVKPRTSGAFGYAIAVLSKDCQANYGNLKVSGNSLVTINNSGMFSNSCMKGNGNVVVTADEGIRFVDGYSADGGVTISPTPAQTAEELPTFTYPPADADCAKLSSYGEVKINNDSDNVTLNPGRYTGISVSKGKVNLNPGLYCVSGDIKLTGGIIAGDDVMFYLQKDGSKDTNFDSSGGAQINIRAPRSGPWYGMLIYLASGNKGSVSLLGNSISEYKGTVYAPDGHVNVGGTSNQLGQFSTQIIAYTAEIFGTTTMEINFDDTIHYSNPSFLDMYE